MLLDSIDFLRRPSASDLSNIEDEQPYKPTHSRSAHQFYSPSAASPYISKHPSKQILPCGCSRSHVLMPQLQDSPKSSKGEGDDIKFKYYLPHLSDRNMDFYTERIRSPRHILDDQAFEMDSAVALGLPYIDEGDFEYYPKSSWSSSPSSRGSEDNSSDSDRSSVLDRSGARYAEAKKQKWFLRFFRSLKNIITRSPGFF